MNWTRENRFVEIRELSLQDQLLTYENNPAAGFCFFKSYALIISQISLYFIHLFFLMIIYFILILTLSWTSKTEFVTISIITVCAVAVTTDAAAVVLIT